MRRNTRALFLATIALSAFLLFTLELVAGRLVLPVFGGTPGVWATTLCFFTAVLFLAYGYAHLVAKHLDARRGGVLQLAVAVVAIGGMLLAPSDVAMLRNPGLAEALNVLLAQLVIAGPAAFCWPPRRRCSRPGTRGGAGTRGGCTPSRTEQASSG